MSTREIHRYYYLWLERKASTFSWFRNCDPTSNLKAEWILNPAIEIPVFSCQVCHVEYCHATAYQWYSLLDYKDYSIYLQLGDYDHRWKIFVESLKKFPFFLNHSKKLTRKLTNSTKTVTPDNTSCCSAKLALETKTVSSVNTRRWDVALGYLTTRKLSWSVFFWGYKIVTLRSFAKLFSLHTL